MTPEALGKIDPQIFSRLTPEMLQDNKYKNNTPRNHHTLASQAEILDKEDDRSFLIKQLQLYKKALTGTVKTVQLVRMLRTLGVSEPTLVSFLGEKSEEANFKPLTEIDPKRILVNKSLFANTFNSVTRVRDFFDDPERVYLDELLMQGTITIGEHLSELIRIRRETIGLMELQIDWMKDTAAKDKVKRGPKLSRAEKRRRNKPTVTVTIEVEEIPDAVETIVTSEITPQPMDIPFGLSDWEVYWAKKAWSHNPNHLVRLPSGYSDMIEAVRILGEGRISIKPKSIIRAVEAHLFSKSAIQRALTARNKYAPEDRKDWIKAKRGKDRIGILLPQEGMEKVIFFADGRDNVYDSLRR